MPPFVASVSPPISFFFFCIPVLFLFFRWKVGTGVRQGVRQLEKKIFHSGISHPIPESTVLASYLVFGFVLGPSA